MAIALASQRSAKLQVSVSRSVSTYHLRGALGFSSGFTPPLGLLIIITSIMTGFHWAERNDSGNEYGYRDRDGDIDNVLSMSVPAARNEISLSLVHECQGFPLQIPFLQLMIFF